MDDRNDCLHVLYVQKFFRVIMDITNIYSSSSDTTWRDIFSSIGGRKNEKRKKKHSRTYVHNNVIVQDQTLIELVTSCLSSVMGIGIDARRTRSKTNKIKRFFFR